MGILWGLFLAKLVFKKCEASICTPGPVRLARLLLLLSRSQSPQHQLGQLP